MLTELLEILISRAIDQGRPTPLWLRPIIALSPALRRYEADARRVDAALTRGAQPWRAASPRPRAARPMLWAAGPLAAAACLALAAALWFTAAPRTATPMAIDPELRQQWLTLTEQASEARLAADEQLTAAAALPNEVFGTLDRTATQLTKGAADGIDALTIDLRSSFQFLLQPVEPWTGTHDRDTPTDRAPNTQMQPHPPV